MKIAEVKIKNFRGYGVNPNVEDGFYSFKDLDSSRFIIFNGFNGFGKTSFFEAIEWCLTNSVKRLKDFAENDSPTNLRNNRYLTFISQNGEQREAIVMICFDNGMTICRKTISNSLQARDYQQNTYLSVNSEQVDLNFDIFQNYSLGKMFSVNFLGQETILDLLRKDKPVDRSSKFLRLIDLNVLNNIQENSSPRNFTFDSRISQAKSKMQELEANKIAAKELLEKVGSGSITDYLQKIEARRNKIKDLVQTLIVEQIKLDFSTVVNQNEITLDNCFDLLNIVKILTNRIQDKLSESLEKRDRKYELEYITNAIEVRQRIIKYNTIKSIDIDELKSAFCINTARKEAVLARYKKLETLKVQYFWGPYFSENRNTEYISSKKINVEVLSDISVKFNTFIDSFDKISINIKDKTISESLFSKINKLKLLSRTLIGKTVLELNNLISDFLDEQRIQLAKIDQMEINLRLLSQLNSSHVDILSRASEYISSLDEVNECPLCLSTEFFSTNAKLELNNLEHTQIKEQLLAIISKQISGGSETIKTNQDLIDNLKSDLKRKYDSVCKSVDERFIASLKDICTCEEDLFVEINNIITDYASRLSKISCNYDTIQVDLQQKINRFEEDYKLLFEEDYAISKKKIDDELIKEEESLLYQLFESINSKKDESNKVYSLEDLVKRRTELTNKVSSLTIKDLDAEVVDCQRLMPELEKWSSLYLNTSEMQIVENIQQYDLQILNKQEECQNLKIDRNIVKTISKNVSDKKDEMLNQLFNNKLISYIYKEINPHYRFNDIVLENKMAGQTSKNYIKGSDENNEIHLNQIFSSAQLNIISLSIFLGMGLPEKSTGLDQLFLDDPIQSMDDMNILALIDVFRNLVDLQNTKNILLSTHDNNFAQLLKIKMRNKAIKVFDFVSYGDEGPIITYN